MFVYYCIVLEISLEGLYGSAYIDEGDSLWLLIPLVFRRTQNPFTVTLFPLSITEAFDSDRFNTGNFIITPYLEFLDDATPGTNVLSQYAYIFVHMMCTLTHRK